MKKALTVIIATLVVLLPTIAGLIIYFMPEDPATQQVSITGTFYDGEGVTFDFTRSKNALLCTFFDELESNSIATELATSRIRYDKIFYANMKKGDVETQMTLYLSGSGYCYYSLPDGSVRRITTSHSQTLLNSSYTVSLYEAINTPILKTFSGETVIPRSRSFKYVLRDGISTQEGKTTPTTSEVRTYYSSKTSVFTFSKKPDICNIKAYVGDDIEYEGPLYEFDSTSLPIGASVRFDIEATWIKGDETTRSFGTASYSFYVVYSPAPTFKLGTSSITAGDMIPVRVGNIRDPKSVTLTAADGIGASFAFFKSGEMYYALIPTDMDLAAGKYKLTLSSGETTTSFEVAIEARNHNESSSVYEISSPITTEQIEEMQGKLSEIGTQCSDSTAAAGKSFINYERAYSDTFTLTLGFGRTRKFNIGESLDMIGVEFSAMDGVSIPVINDGTVCAVGEDPILGKYVVVDHGCGLMSWYCNISESTAQLGESLERGDTVAKAGKSACYGQSGFYLITTVLGQPVSPYSVYENGFTLFN